jgi:hypothetical protein
MVDRVVTELEVTALVVDVVALLVPLFDVVDTSVGPVFGLVRGEPAGCSGELDFVSIVVIVVTSVY